jgi:CheY-like chemotaxis protein
MSETENLGMVLVVDDNEDIVINIKIFLEFNGFGVITAYNGREALDTLSTLDSTPDVIVSDIMMPEMDGYDFFKALSNDTRYSHVPFIFLSAKSSPEDIRLGKILGVDDYMTKPFNQDDLLASIKGKIARSKNALQITNVLANSFNAIKTGACDESQMVMPAYIMYISWDDKLGPVLLNYYPVEVKPTFNIHDIGYQLFNAATAIYGDQFAASAEGVVLTLANIQQQAFLFFDSYPDETTRSGVVLFMLGVIHPCISYLSSLSIKKVLQEISSAIKAKKTFDLGKFQLRISRILQSSG